MDVLTRMLNRELLRSAVARVRFCPLTGEMLDVGTAVLVDASDYGGGMAVVAGNAWDADSGLVVKTVLACGGTGFVVIDGREL